MSKNYYDCRDGYYYVKNVYRDRPLKYRPCGQCGILENDETIALQSYTTTVLVLNKMTGWLYCTGLYSNTTRRHIGLWLKEVCPNVSYYTIKKCYNDGMIYNVYTGECLNYDEYNKMIEKGA